MKTVHIEALVTALLIGSSVVAGAQRAGTPQQGGTGAVRSRGHEQLTRIELSPDDGCSRADAARVRAVTNGPPGACLRSGR